MNHVRLVVLLFLALSLLAAPAPLQAQDDLARIQQALEKNMARQAPLTDEDVRVYLKYVEPIYALRFEPDRRPDVIREINFWDENRFAYVTTKMAVGLSLLLRPGDSRNNAIPRFARPTTAEMDLIKVYQDDLARAMESLQDKYAANNSPS